MKSFLSTYSINNFFVTKGYLGTLLFCAQAELVLLLCLSSPLNALLYISFIYLLSELFFSVHLLSERSQASPSKVFSKKASPGITSSFNRQETSRIAEKQDLSRKEFHTALNDMASSFAHQINNPLTIVSTSLSLMRIKLERDHFDKGKFLHMLDKSESSIKRIIQSVDCLRSQTKKKEIQCVYSASELIEHLNSKLKVLIENQDCSIDLSCDSSEYYDSLFIRINLDLVLKAFTNIVQNALNAAISNVDFLQKSWIQISFEQTAKNFNILISDSGPGIAPEHRDRIFTPMFTTHHNQKSAGLGLTQAKSYILYNKGTLKLRPETPYTTFELSLPIHRELKCSSSFKKAA